MQFCRQLSYEVMVSIFVNCHSLGARGEAAMLESSQFAHLKLRPRHLVREYIQLLGTTEMKWWRSAFTRLSRKWLHLPLQPLPTRYSLSEENVAYLEAQKNARTQKKTELKGTPRSASFVP